MKRYRNLLLIVLAFVAGGFATLATTIALAHGGDTNLVHACVKNNPSNMPNVRIVGANDTCNSNESPLDWPKTGDGNGFTIVDSQNQKVGSFFGNMPLREIGNYWVSIRASSLGLLPHRLFLYYESFDCSGTPQVDAGSGLIREGITFGDTIYYAGDPLIQGANSLREFTPPDSYGACEQNSSPNDIYGPLQSSQLPTFVPPFSISP